MLSFRIEAKLVQAIGTRWFMRKPPRLRGWQWVRQELEVGLSLFLEFKFEPEPERDQACPTLWLQGFRLLLKSCALARYHRPELNDCLVISDATPPQPSSSPPLPPDTAASLTICPPQSPALGETQHLAYSPHLKLADRHTFMHLSLHIFSTQLLPSCSWKISVDSAEF